MLRDLLVHVDGSLGSRRRVRLATNLAMRTGSRLSGIHVTPPAEVPSQFKPSLVEKVRADLSVSLAHNAVAAAQVFREETTTHPLDTCWFDESGDVAQGITERARHVDLVVLGQYEGQGPVERHPLPAAHSVVMRCGRPVLLVPPRIKRDWLDNALVAWDGSREVVRAIHDVLPLLRLSQSVKILVVAGPSGTDRGAENVVDHLARHGIRSDTDVRRSQDVAEHPLLSTAIRQGQYGLLVMGAYSHPKWLELLFGGATASILLTATMPVLVSH